MDFDAIVLAGGQGSRMGHVSKADLDVSGERLLDIVLRAITIRGSIVGTRQDMIEALDFYARGEIHPTVTTRSLDEVNEIFDEMEKGKIDGRIVMTY